MTTDNMHLEPRPDLSDWDVMMLIKEECNANEIAAYARVSLAAAYAMMARATRLFANPVKRG